MSTKTDRELMEEIAGNQGLTLKEVKEAKAEAAQAKKEAADLKAEVDKLNLEHKGTIDQLLEDVKEAKARGGSIARFFCRPDIGGS